MSESKFTPAPWRITREGEWIIGRDEKVGDVLIACVGLQPNMEANTALILAAPDLYSVLQELEESVDYWSEYDVPIGIQERIKSVLKKARGEK